MAVAGGVAAIGIKMKCCDSTDDDDNEEGLQCHLPQFPRSSKPYRADDGRIQYTEGAYDGIE